MSAVDPTTGVFWDSLRVELTNGDVVNVRGLPKGKAANLSHIWLAFGLAPAAAAVAQAFRQLLNQDAYVNRRALTELQSRARELRSLVPSAFGEIPLPEEIAHDFADCRRCLESGEQVVDERNDDFIRRKKLEHARWFSSAGGKYGLTDEQQEAILRDEDNCLVVAGAGTGKTSTVAGKVGYLIRTGAARPDEILLLSFARKAAEEMAERIASTVGESVTQQIRTATFHGLGVEIVATADGIRPSLSRFAEDQRSLAIALVTYVTELFTARETQAEAIEFFAYFRFPYRSPFSYENPHGYHQHILGHDLRTLRGEKVKSHEELFIANWLFLHGVAYEYERSYEHVTATIERRQYKPDFYLSEQDVYLEHFGIDRNGNTAPCVDREEYQKDMAWKRETHARFGTRLIETYSYDQLEGVLLQRLAERLVAVGVTLRPRDPHEVLAAVEEQKLVAPMAKLLVTFLNLFKGNLWTLGEVDAAARSLAPKADVQRALSFLRMFRRVLDRYEVWLSSSNEIDFNDMIALATEHVEAGRYVSQFRYVIVDEFQDLSRGRGRLLRALLAQVPDRRLFCVGDDWQSIYRFTGSDIEQMTRFSEVFGFTRRSDLTLTHRLNKELLDASSAFVQQNPQQIRKSLVAPRSLGEPAIEVHAAGTGEGPDQLLEHALSRIAGYAVRDLPPRSASKTRRPTVLVLGRYNFTKPRTWTRLLQRHTTLSLEYLTVHRSKGLEADYTVILDVIEGRMGFPSEVADDPVLDLVIAGGGSFPNAEERRLFYVALTRAKHRCLILTDKARRSKFAEELEGSDYRAWVATDDATSKRALCPKCRGGRLLLRGGEYGPFWGCSNYPLCEGRAKLCQACGAGALIPDALSFRCTAPACNHEVPRCPSCGRGYLIERDGPYGRFLGCSEWRPDGTGWSCTYKQKDGAAIRSRRRTRKR